MGHIPKASKSHQPQHKQKHFNQIYSVDINDIKWILQTSGIIPSHLPPSRSKVLPGFLRLLGRAQGLHRDLQVLRAGYLPSIGTAWQELSPWAHQNDGSP